MTVPGRCCDIYAKHLFEHQLERESTNRMKDDSCTGSESSPLKRRLTDNPVKRAMRKVGQLPKARAKDAAQRPSGKTQTSSDQRRAPVGQNQSQPLVTASPVPIEETDEIRQIRRELVEASTALANEKRQRQKAKERCELSAKNLAAARKETDAVQKKLESATTLLAAASWQDKDEIAAAIESLNDEYARLSREYSSVERHVNRLANANVSKTRGKLQKAVAVIRVTDDGKKLQALKKKVAALEATVEQQQREVDKLKAPVSLNPSIPALVPIIAKVSGSAVDLTSTFASLEAQKQAFQSQLAKLQDDITRTAKQHQHENSTTLQEMTRKNNLLSVEFAHLEQQRIVKESETVALQNEVDRLTKVLERGKKRREALEQERLQVEAEGQGIAEKSQATQLKIQETSNALNQVMLMSSEAPVMHEKAWAHEKTSLQTTLNSIQSKNKKLQADLQQLNGKLDAIKQEAVVETELCRQERELLKKLDVHRHALQEAVAALQSLGSTAALDDGSQKEQIIRDLESAVKTERRKAEETQALNDRLDKKLQAARQLLQQHGMDM